MRFSPILCATVLAAALASWAALAATPAAPEAVLTVNGRTITAAEFEQTLAAAVRNRYYHRAPPEGDMAIVKRDVADALIELALAADEARRRGMEPDAAQVDRDLQKIEVRFRAMPGWAERRDAQVARWRVDLEDRNLAEALEKNVRASVAPTAAEVRRFYDTNPALFTEPEKVRIGLILLKVDPAAGRAARDRAREEAAAIRQRLAKGGDFAELASIHSGDESASRGGDVGFVHRGALPEAVQVAVDPLNGGAVSDPVDILEGVAIVRVSERTAAQLRPYDAVEARARELLRRRAADEAWKLFVAGLRSHATVEIDTRRYPELAAAGAARKADAATQ